MPSAANAKSEKPASSEATDNSPVRQIITVIEHKIRNLEKRKSKLTSYRDLQKAGKELNTDQKVAVAKYDEVVQTLDFARDLSKQITAIVSSAEREAKKQAKKDAWVRYAAETNKIREVLLILDCLMQMGSSEAREDFLNGTNGAAKLTEDDLKILDELYPEVTPKHELNEEGQSGFHMQTVKAAEHLYAIIDGKPKEILGTTYAHIKEIVTTVHECGYFDKSGDDATPVENDEVHVIVDEEQQHVITLEVEETNAVPYPPPAMLPPAPAPSVVPAPAYPLRPLPPITLQEVEHAYFSQQYPQQRPISEVIGSQNFFFLQDSEIDSPIGTPHPPQIMNQPSPPAPIPTQTFTNQHFVQLPGARVPEQTMPMPPQPHFAPHHEHAGYPGVPLPASLPPQQPLVHPQPIPQPQMQPMPQPLPQTVLIEQQLPVLVEERKAPTPNEDKNEDEWKESRSPENEEGYERKTQGQGDGQNRYRRYGRTVIRGSSNGYRGRGSYQNRQNDGYHPRGEYQNRGNKDGYQNRQYDGYQNRHKDGYQNRAGSEYYGNGDTGDSHHHENGGRDRYDTNQYQGGFKSRGRGGPRGGARGAPRAPRPQHYNRKPDNVE
ncbi:PREDICTED: caprin homolog [Papilio polytes]|uniref:caprin homolog n=1 Tax=Papilio polytes TaxID=76194 RepID=UPI0006763DD8|nr:PREDICTED: caprin homolog [Papilio polytes]